MTGRVQHPVGQEHVARQGFVEVHMRGPWGMVHEVWVFPFTWDCE